MAEIVLGIGTSHGPLLSTPPEQWDLRAKADRANKQHAYRGKMYDYEGLLQERAPGFAGEIGIETRRDRYERRGRWMVKEQLRESVERGLPRRARLDRGGEPVGPGHDDKP